ncbi:MAG: hypothetical protein U5L09_17925 [Bacteroidales bacterium]|nr:hypothetical protein [Bacteroidales bacterium]
MTIIGNKLFQEEPYKKLEDIKEKRIDKISSPCNTAIDDIPDISEEEFGEKTMNQVKLDIPLFYYDNLKKK